MTASAPGSSRGSRSAPGACGEVALRRYVATCLEQARPCVRAIAEGSPEPEDVHQLRAGLRRLRALLRELAEWAGSLDAGWEAPVLDAFAALGAVRDRQVMALTLAPRLARAGAPLACIADAALDEAQLRHLVELVRGQAFQAALAHLLAFANGAPADACVPAAARSEGLVRRRLAALRRRVKRDAGHFEALAFAQQHRVRKRLKRLRCLAAFAAPLYSRRRVSAWLEQADAAQACLGRHNDLMAAALRFRDAAATDARAWFAVGWLQARSRASARQCRKSLERLARTPVFW